MAISIIGFSYSAQFKRFYNICKYSAFNTVSIGIYALALILLFITGNSYNPIDSFIPVFNIRFIAFIFAIATSVAFVKWTKAETYKYLAIGLGFSLISFETMDYVKIIPNVGYLLTVMWLVYAGIITLIGIFKNIESLKKSGIWISIAAIIRIFAFDLADTDMMYKLIAFITLGTILLIVSYFYNKKR